MYCSGSCASPKYSQVRYSSEVGSSISPASSAAAINSTEVGSPSSVPLMSPPSPATGSSEAGDDADDAVPAAVPAPRSSPATGSPVTEVHPASSATTTTPMANCALVAAPRRLGRKVVICDPQQSGERSKATRASPGHHVRPERSLAFDH